MAMKNLIRSATRHFRKPEKFDYYQMGQCTSVAGLLEVLHIDYRNYPKATKEKLGTFISLDKDGLRELGFEKEVAAKIRRALDNLANWFKAQIPTVIEEEADETESESDLTCAEFWQEFTSAPPFKFISSPPLDLPMAIMSENTRAIENLLSNYPDPKYINKRYRDGWTSLMCACVIAKDKTIMKKVNGVVHKTREYPFINKLLHAGASLKTRNDKGQTALMLAASYGHYDVVELLFQWCPKDEDIKYANMKDNEGRTALHHAASFQQLDSIRVLLEHYADPNFQDKKGMTPLMIVSGGEEDRVLEFGIRVMVEYDGNPTLKNNEGDDCFEMIRNLGFPKAERLLVEAAKAFQNCNKKM